MNTKHLNIGMIGLDTSHCEAFTKLLNDSSHPYHVEGGRVISAYPGGSEDFELSINRVDQITDTLKEQYGIIIRDSIRAVAEESDAILLTSVDGRVHLEQFENIVSLGKPVFIDKPFAVRSDHARKMFELAEKHQTPLMSASSLRFSVELDEALADAEEGSIIGVDSFGPMNIQETQGGLFWYGIHSAEMLFRAMGKGCVEVQATTNEAYEMVVGVWEDGRIGTLRGNRKGNSLFGVTIHREGGTQFVNASKHPKPNYAGLLECAIPFFQNGEASINPQETIEIIRFLEAANESRETGKAVKL
ncbi:Gfo/Idh/MocA family oxidoreductase [Paenibacillus sp. HB172176]|uniref:Gfo/Idh/MocA family protein n=1 Tax=Paenibacillus sp. HB172176 TaxID=2493690 RepID=UPI00143A1B59|nr:Gfo/Idh/MocA family oxidoreductase [Paenibacillus sp. HB172176]